VVDENDISAAGDEQHIDINSGLQKHALELLSLKERHKAPQALLNDVLIYIHEHVLPPNQPTTIPTPYAQIRDTLRKSVPSYIRVG
jgi:hypothetical protein